MPRGGDRIGSGRKKLPECDKRIKTSITLDAETLAWVKKLGSSPTINRALDISHRLVENAILLQTLDAIALTRGIAIGELVEELLIEAVTG